MDPVRSPDGTGPHPDRNFWLLVTDAGLFGLAIVCFDPNVVLPVFVAQFTTSPVLIGAPAAILLAGLYLPQLPSALFVRRFQRIKGFLMWQVLTGRVALLVCLPIALAAGRLPSEVVVAVFLFAFAVFTFTDGAGSLAWLDLVGDVVHPRLRGRYFGLIQLLGGVAAIGAGFGARALLANATAPSDFVPLFACGCVALFLSAACISMVREPRGVSRPVHDEPTFSYIITLLRGGQLVRLGVAHLLAGSLQLALPFYALFGRDRLDLSSEWLGAFIVAQTTGASAAALLWARVAEIYGARVVITLSAGLLVLVPVIAGLAERGGGGPLLVIVFGLAGAASGGSNVGFAQYILDLVPARDRRMFMGLANTANAPTLLMPVAGGLLLAWGDYDWLLAGAVVGGLGATISSLWLARPIRERA